MRKISILALLLLFLTFNLVNVNAAEKGYSPTTQFFVNDFANVLSDSAEQEIVTIGKKVESTTTAQLVVVTVPNMNGDYIESYANKLFNRWGIGVKNKNNGILLILSKDDRKIRIEVGYGLEGAINDAKAGRILDKYAIPSLKNNNYDKAIIDTVIQIQGEIYNEYGIDNSVENPKYIPENTNIEIDAKYIVIGIAIFILLIIVTKGKIFNFILWLIVLGGRRRVRRRIIWWLFWRWFFRRRRVIRWWRLFKGVLKYKLLK